MAEKKFDGVTFRTDPLAAKDALALYIDIMRIVGKAAGRLPSIMVAMTAPDMGEPIADVAALMAITDILVDTPTADIIEVIERIIGAAQVLQPSKTYRAATLDGDFSLDRKNLVPVITWILKEQFSDFFTGSGPNGIFSLFRAGLVNRK